MYGNTSFAGAGADGSDLSAEQRRTLRRDLASLAAHTRTLLPDEFVVGSELVEGMDGPEATVAVQPPVGQVVSAGYTPEVDADVGIEEPEREDIARGLAASAALQVKRSIGEDVSAAAQ